MGNKSSFEKQTDFPDANTNFEYQNKVSTPLGDLKSLQGKSFGSKVFEKEHTFNSQSSYDAFLNYVKFSKAFDHPNLLKLYGCNTSKEESFCAENFKLSLYFESFERTLEDEIETRHKDKNYFTEYDLWLLLDSITSVGAYLQSMSQYHGDIRPSHIVIIDNTYKLAGKILLPEAIHHNVVKFKNLAKGDQKAYYLGPQAFNCAKNDTDGVEYAIFRNDVFALGMTMLEAACLEKVQGVYDYRSYQMSQRPIEDALLNLRDMYSEKLVLAIGSLLKFDEGVRPDFVTLDQTIAQYRKQLNMKLAPAPSFTLINMSQDQENKSKLELSRAPSGVLGSGAGPKPLYEKEKGL